MFLIWAIVLGLLLGFLRKGSLRNLAAVKLHAPWLILIALGIQLLIFPLGRSDPLVKFGTEYLHILSYIFLLGFLILNWPYWQVVLMGLGMISNLLVISLNGGYMPASESALRGAGLDEVADLLIQGSTHGNVILMSSQTKLNFLGDILHVPAWVPFANAFSPGDLLLALGIILFLQGRMKRAYDED